MTSPFFHNVYSAVQESTTEYSNKGVYSIVDLDCIPPSLLDFDQLLSGKTAKSLKSITLEPIPYYPSFSLAL